MTDQVTEKIRNLIIDQGLTEGDRLPTELELTQMFGVSRIVVREAIKSLSFLGILDTKPRRGTVVGALDMERLGRCLSFHGAVTNYPRSEILEARIAIEVSHLELVAERLTEDATARLMKQVERLEHAAEHNDAHEFKRRDSAYHRMLLEIGGNPILMTFCDLLKQYFRDDAPLHMSQAELFVVVQEHRMIVEALQEKNLPLAQGMLKRHLSRPMRDLLRAEVQREPNATNRKDLL
ncbi:MAG: FCD domain-containing protein [Candidatus Marinimicrobia bacterium]|nr:FCD domain-containing protein [Candidatus Neomarinimicrobiota bacterium]